MNGPEICRGGLLQSKVKMSGAARARTLEVSGTTQTLMDGRMLALRLISWGGNGEHAGALDVLEVTRMWP